MHKKVLVIAASVCFAVAAHAQVSIAANGVSVLALSDSGTTLATGDAIRIGYIPSSDLSLFETSDDYSTLNADFQPIGEGVSNGGSLSESPTPSGIYLDINNAGVTGGFSGQFTNVSNLAVGDQLYLWIFNNANPANATQWGIFTGQTAAQNSNSAWLFPASPVPGGTQLSLATATTAVVGTQLTSGPNSGDFELANVVSVPEPGSLSLLAGAFALGGLAMRRRK